jgi:hypothetical protein
MYGFKKRTEREVRIFGVSCDLIPALVGLGCPYLGP